MFFKKKNKTFTSVIIPAAGSGKRMGADKNKIFLELLNIPVLARTLSVFNDMDEINEIIVVASENDIFEVSALAESYRISKLKSVVLGGAERQDSVRNGLRELSPESEIVLIHDAARPLIQKEVIKEIIENVKLFGASACGAKCKNTVKLIDDDGYIKETLNRDYLLEIHTPQGFKSDLITSAYENADKNGFTATDDCMVAEHFGAKIKVVFEGTDNIKITTYDDLAIAEQILEKRGEK